MWKILKNHKGANIDDVIGKVIKYIHDLFSGCEIQVRLYAVRFK